MADEQPWSRVKSELYSFVGRNPRSNKRLVRFARLSPDDHVLDIGCGPGAAVRRAGRIAVAGSATGVDASAGMVAIARRRSTGIPNVAFELGAAEALPFADERFTRVWTIHAYHHWNDTGAGLAESLRVLAPGGSLLISETRGSSSHGMSTAEAQRVIDVMNSLGFVDTSAERVFREIVVVGKKPA